MSLLYGHLVHRVCPTSSPFQVPLQIKELKYIQIYRSMILCMLIMVVGFKVVLVDSKSYME